MPNNIQLQIPKIVLDRRAVKIEGISYKTDSDGNLKVFNVEHNKDDRWLNSNYANPENFYNGNKVWVFARNYLCFSRPEREFC